MFLHFSSGIEVGESGVSLEINQSTVVFKSEIRKEVRNFFSYGGADNSTRRLTVSATDKWSRGQFI